MFIVAVTSACKKDDTQTSGKLDPNQLTSVQSSATSISSQLQLFMNSTLIQAAGSGQNIPQPPQVPSSALNALLNSTPLKSGALGWVGPDADGWYSMSYSGIYTYTYKVRYKDSTITCITSFNYSGGDGSYSNTTTTQYTRYTKNKKVLWKGSCDLKINAFGDNDISNLEWDFLFNDWDPTTGAGTYDWYWGVTSLGGGTVPYHRYLNIISTGTGVTPLNLHVKVTWYDDGGVQVGSFEYNTSWTPIDMPAWPS